MYKVLLKKILLTITSVLIISNVNALKIEINRGQTKPEPIVIKKNNNHDTLAKLIAIIENDLKLSALFNILPDNNIDIKNLKEWQKQGVRFLVYGKQDGDQVIFTLIDVITGKKLINNKVVNINQSNIRETAHAIADYIYERVTNELGYFKTKIVYVTTVNNAPRTTKLVMMDQDGANVKSLTNGKELVLSPRFSSTGKNIAYIAYTTSKKARDTLDRSVHVYICNLEDNSRRRLLNDSIMKELIKKNKGNPVSMTYAPRFSPNDQSVVFAIIIEGKSAIYKYNMTDNKLIQLTKHENIDTSPCYSPDGKKIVFTSNRVGTEALYVMNANGSNQHKISQEGGKYSQPVWSPRGDLIAFTKQINNDFYIGLVKPDGSGERLIAKAYLVEAPIWSSNGRYIVCTYQESSSAKSKILFMDLTGRHRRKIETKGDASSPAWSPTVKNNK